VSTADSFEEPFGISGHLRGCASSAC
jgi:hypothetical protein